jgi:MSHA biogenesis protein MshJ
MNLDAVWLNLKGRFNAMSLRERAMISAAMLALVVFAWDRALMNPLNLRKQQLQADLAATQQGLATLAATIQGRAEDNPLIQAMKKKQSLTESLAAVDHELQSTSAGLIPPQRMLDALRDVLANQSGLHLVSMRNLPVTSLIAIQPVANEQASSPAAAPQTAPQMQGPYVHSLEFVIEGGYLDVLRYLEKVEALPWRFYWQVLELKTAEYPLNRVRIRLNTLSMDREWLGV